MRRSAFIPLVPLVPLVALALLLAACGGGSGTAATSPTDTPVPPTATTAPSPTDTAAATPANSAATVTMARTTFGPNRDISIKAGQSVTFDDPSSGGGVHQLVTGQNGTFTAVNGAPSQFASSSGIAFAPGTTMTIAFPNAGTFPITCMIHPAMQVTITVTA